MALLALGFVLLHREAVERSGWLRLTGAILVVTGVLGGLCTGYFWFRSHGQGDFDRAHPTAQIPGGREGMPMPMPMHERGMREGAPAER